MGTVTASFRHTWAVNLNRSIFCNLYYINYWYCFEMLVRNLVWFVRLSLMRKNQILFCTVQETGLGIGLISGVVVLGIVSLWLGNIVLGGIIGFAVLASIFVAASLTGGHVFTRCWINSSPDQSIRQCDSFITTVNDLTSVLVLHDYESTYFSIAANSSARV